MRRGKPVWSIRLFLATWTDNSEGHGSQQHWEGLDALPKTVAWLIVVHAPWSRYLEQKFLPHSGKGYGPTGALCVATLGPHHLSSTLRRPPE